MLVEIESDDRSAVEHVVLRHLWHAHDVRLVAHRRDDRYAVTMYTMENEPDAMASASASDADSPSR